MKSSSAVERATERVPAVTCRHAILSVGLLLLLPGSPSAAEPAAAGTEASAPRSAEQLRTRAAAGESVAELQLGFEYFYGRNRVRNLAQAAFWFGRAAQHGSAQGQYNLAICYEKGWGVVANPGQAAELFRQAAASLPEAKFEYALRLAVGVEPDTLSKPPQPGLPADRKQAIALLDELVNNRFPGAARELALILLSQSVKPNDDERRRAVALLESASSGGDALARRRLADCYFSGIGIGVDEKKAVALLEAAVRDNDSEAVPKLAYACENGLGMPPDSARAFALYTRAAEQDLPFVWARLGVFYLTGRETAVDVPRAVALFKRAAERREPCALTRLADCHAVGLGVEKDPVRAFELFFAAARQDYPEAQYRLGKAFLDGVGTPADAGAAVYWFKQAAFRHEPSAQKELGICLLNGVGAEIDITVGWQWLERAARNGDMEALALVRDAEAHRPAAADDADERAAEPVGGLQFQSP